MSQTFYANGEQLVDREEARASFSGIALAASLLLHLGIAGLVFFKQSDTKLPEAIPPKTAMVVTISSTNPQRKQPPTAADADIQIENPVPEIPEDQRVEVSEPAAEITAEEIIAAEQTVAEQTASPDQSAADQSTVNSSTEVAPTFELPADQAAESSGISGISTTRLNNSVTAYIANYKSSLTSDWLSECLKYQNEHGVKTCPQGEDGKSENTNALNETTNHLFRVYVSGGAENARASKKLLAEMDAMQVFMEENSVMGELARQRYELAKANYCNFNSCRGPALITSENFATPIFATPISNEGFVSLLGLGSAGPGILQDLIGLTMEAKPQAVKPFVPYSFTATPSQQAESESEFKVETPLFPIRE